MPGVVGVEEGVCAAYLASLQLVLTGLVLLKSFAYDYNNLVFKKILLMKLKIVKMFQEFWGKERLLFSLKISQYLCTE